jgi:hypothetical protein
MIFIRQNFQRKASGNALPEFGSCLRGLAAARGKKTWKTAE